jgi:UDP:flavonoid glycosyltransferase YjiC (YdhE family)
MRAGIPQLIMPMHTDQPHNALQLRRLGVGQYVSPRRFRGPQLARSLEHLLNPHEVAPSCAEVAARFVGVPPFAKACRVLEEYGAQRGLPPGTKACDPLIQG